MNAYSLRTLAGLLLAVLAPVPSLAGSPAFPDTINLKGTKLVKVGESSYSWLWFKLYDGALYLEDGHSGADPLGDRIRCLELAYARNLEANAFRESGRRILQETLSNTQWAAIEERLNLLHDAFEPVQAGDRYTLAYVPGEGTTLYLNGVALITLPGADFARAYFSIWLGNHPAKADFREELFADATP